MRRSVKWPSSCFVRWVFLCSVAPLSANTGMTCDQTQRRIRFAGQLCETPTQPAEPLLKRLINPMLSISRSPLAASAHRRLALVKHLPSWTVKMPLPPWHLGRAQSGAPDRRVDEAHFLLLLTQHHGLPVTALPAYHLEDYSRSTPPAQTSTPHPAIVGRS